MKLGISTWSLLGSDVNSAIRTIGDAGFEYIELWGEVPHAYPDWVDRKSLKETLSTYRMTVTMHAPFTDLNPATPFEPVKGAVAKTLKEFVKFSDYLGAAIITVHPGSVHNEALVPNSTQNSITIMKDLVKESGGRLGINIENQTRSRSKYHFPLASTLESLDVLLAEVEGTGFTLDTGHAHVNGHDPLAVADRVRPRLTEVHLSDNGGASDDHLVPGEGNANLQSLLAQFAQSNLLLCLELDPHRYNQDRVMQAASEVKMRLASGARRQA